MCSHSVTKKTHSNGRDQLITIPQFLLDNASRFASKPAMRHKDFGIWQSWNWAQMHDEIRVFSLGLKELGLKPGEKIAIIGSNRPRLYWTFCAAQALGAIPVPIYSDSVADEMEFVLEHAEVAMAVCQDQEQVDKVLSMSEQEGKLSTVRAIIYDEIRGMNDYELDELVSYHEVQKLGETALGEGDTKAEWVRKIQSAKPDDLAVILYTSGTTGQPKGVMLSNDNIVKSSLSANEFDDFDENEQVVAYLPMAWVGDHVFSYAQSYAAGYCVCCPESVETIDEDRREIAPTYFFAPPRVFETMLTTIMVRMEDAGNFKKKMFRYFLDHASKFGERILNGQKVGIFDRLIYLIGDLTVYGPLKNRLGFSNMKVGYTAGEAIGPEIFKFYRSLGLNLKQLYGQTEGSVYISAQPDGEIRAETVGRPTPGVEIEIDKTGEIMYRSPGVFIGYYKNKKSTEQTKTKDGWVHTGDAGFIDDEGHLRIIDRAKDVGKLNDGSLFAPKYIENKLKFYPNIKEAVAFGDGKDFCGVILNIDLVAVGNWAERNNIAYASYQELAGHPQVYEMMGEHIEQVNRDLSGEDMMSGSQIHRFLVLHKELDADDGELTRTQKVRRTFIGERYLPLIDALYDGSTQTQIDIEVTFEDGRKGNISGTMQVHDVKVFEPVGAIQSHREAAE